MTLSQGTRLGPYEVVALLGAGGMGEVYRARDSRLGREVAIKVVLPGIARVPERLRRFEQEARAAGALNHPNILAIYDFGTHEGAPYMVSELLEGQTLRARLVESRLALRKVMDYALQVAAGLAAAHQKGIVHRDLKPENIFLTTDGRAKILDFGLAKLIEPDSGGPYDVDAPTVSLMSEPGAVMGTVGYMSPEQVQGLPADHRCDVFSFGVILYEMLVGQRAFRRSTAVETMHAILKEEPQGLTELDPNCPADLDRLVRHCLEKSPEERFQSVRDLRFELERLAEDANRSRKPPLMARPASRRRAVAVLAGVTLLAAVIFFAGRRTGSSPAVSVLAFQQLTFRLGTISSARFAPDGQTIIYSAGWYGKPTELFTTRPEGPESRALGYGTSGLLAVSSSGELAITAGCELNWGSCSGTLARVPLAGGAPRQLLEDVYYADWSPDGKTLAVVRVVQGRVRLEFPIGKVLYETAGWITSPRVSPKGDLVAFLDHPTLGTNLGSVAVVDLAGNKRTITRASGGLFGLAWHPITGEIWFSASRKGATNALALYGVTLAGRERLVYAAPGELLLHDITPDGRLLLDRSSSRSRIMLRSGDSEQDRDLSWFIWSSAAGLSADAKMLLFSEWGRAVPTPAIYILKTDDSEAIRLGEGKALALSPDGKWVLAFQETPPHQLLLMPTGPGEQRQLPRGGIVEYVSGVWFPDDKRILLVAEENDRIPRSYVQDVDGADPQRVGPEGMLAVLVSPDGKRLAGYGGDQGFYLYSLDSQKAAPIPGLEKGDTLIQWSADGRSLFASPPGDLPVRIIRVELATGRRELWKQFRPPEAAGSLGVHADQKGVLLTPDGKSLVYTHWSLLNELYLVDGLR